MAKHKKSLQFAALPWRLDDRGVRPFSSPNSSACDPIVTRLGSSECPAGFVRNRWLVSIGIDGCNRRNTHPDRMLNRLQPTEYARPRLVAVPQTEGLRKCRTSLLLALQAAPSRQMPTLWHDRPSSNVGVDPFSNGTRRPGPTRWRPTPSATISKPPRRPPAPKRCGLRGFD